MEKNSINLFSHRFLIIKIVIIILAISVSFLISCEKRKEKGETGKVSLIEVTPVQILITDLDGDVYKIDDDELIEVIIEDILTESDIVKTEQGAYCELQFGETALVRMEENTILRMNAVLTELGQADISLGMDLGTLLCKVNKLVENERFEVNTPAVVFGVRGTRFGVEVTDAEDASLFVEEGACAVIPASITPEKIAGKLEDNPELARILIEEVEKNVLIVKADQEVKINKSSFKETEVFFEEVNKAMDEVSKKDTVDDETKTKLKELVKASTEEVINRGTKVDIVSDSHKNELKKIEKIKKKEIQIKTNKFKLEEEKEEIEEKEIIEQSSKDEEKKITEEKKEKTKQYILIHSKPDKAKVYLNGQYTGDTPVTIKDKLPGKYELTVEKNGYKSYNQKIELIAGKNYSLDLLLEEEGPEFGKVMIYTHPEKASLYFNGEYIGTTPGYKDNVEYGEYEIVLQLRGYSSLSRVIIVDEKDEKFVYTLNAETCEVADINDIIDLVGPPDNYSKQELDELRKLKTYAEPIDFIYSRRFYFEIIDAHLASILLTGNKKDFYFVNNIGIGSSRADVEELLGEPDAILAEGKLLKYSKIGVTLELNTEGMVSSFRLYKLDPLLTLEPLEDAAPELVDFFNRLHELPSHYGID
ncbi:MAG: PEGA domain-containing protein [Spirochaetales bacterium]|nr:PEGA domain-containing protein [Spirochaetales bacterium]